MYYIICGPPKMHFSHHYGETNAAVEDYILSYSAELCALVSGEWQLILLFLA